MIKEITNQIAYIPATDSPLSADIGLITGEKSIYIFDTGDGDASFRELTKYLKDFPDKETCLIVSHFHKDHTGNFGRHDFSRAYVGSFTAKYVAPSEIVTSPVVIEDGVKLMIFPLPSSHAKGSLGLMVNDEFVFLGDGTYSNEAKGEAVYNRGLLQQELKVLKALPAGKFLLSHKPRFIYPAKVVIRELESVYDRRVQGEAFIKA
ncbi:MAG: MBL fold metallo-hydrolase [Lachnospiraceae bacterium]|nr:MBL fold metallo-hydrolase [Lachnospiraceae bacterium]